MFFMGRFHSYINSATAIISSYKGDEPLASFLKKYFAAYKKYGSKDRKQVSHLCYCYFRTARLFAAKDTEENILASLFLCSSESNEILAELRPEWENKVSLPTAEKCSVLNIQYDLFCLFPWKDELSEGVEYGKFNESFLIQPDLFTRVRPGYKKAVTSKLKAASVSFKSINEHCLALPNNSKLDDLLELNKEAVVQDYSSQRVGEMLQIVKTHGPAKTKVWDCCAASGGKSILARDILEDIDLTVSDIRESIIANLKRRFKDAGIINYKSLQHDLSAAPLIGHPSYFDLVIADVPCSGSGTWARTPEQLYYFDVNKIEEYARLQQKIISNAVPGLKAGGFFLYITCSVFREENEANVEYIKEQFHLELIKMELLKGYNMKADTMFAALFRKSL